VCVVYSILFSGMREKHVRSRSLMSRLSREWPPRNGALGSGHTLAGVFVLLQYLTLCMGMVLNSYGREIFLGLCVKRLVSFVWYAAPNGLPWLFSSMESTCTTWF